MTGIILTCARLVCKEVYDNSAPGYVDVDDLRYGVKAVNGVTIVAIRGTANAENWLRDASAWPKRSCGGYLAHAGFVDAYRKLCAGGMLKGLPVRGKIVVTGHSLGGAIATLCAEHLGCQVVTFGSPRVYFRFASAPSLDHTRVINDDDPVPMVPKFLYSHRCDPLTLPDHDGHLIDVADHFGAEYLCRVEALHH